MDWSRTECEAIVADYMAMLASELKGEAYSKAEHRRALQLKLSNRSEGSIEYKHQNISAILIESGYPYVTGYKPASNYQQLLRETVISRLSDSSIRETADELIAVDPVFVDDFSFKNVVTAAPLIEGDMRQSSLREFSPRQYNFVDRERQNKKLGELGEEFVMRYERYRLESAGRSDLVRDLEWTSKERGDGAGYDIRSFDPDDDSELYIEVKTTKLGKYLPFYLTSNEVEFSKLHDAQYSLYRVYEFRQQPKLFQLNGDISRNVNLEAVSFRAGFK